MGMAPRSAAIATRVDSNEGPVGEDSLTEAVQSALEATTSVLEKASSAGVWKTPAFEFARRLKGRPELGQLSAVKAADRIECKLVKVTGDANFPWVTGLGDIDSLGERVDPYSDFIKCWDSVQRPGGNTLQSAVKQASEPDDPAEFGERLSRRGREGARRFYRTCRVLQELAGDDPFYIAIESGAEAFGVDGRQISRWFYAGVKHGLLEKVEEAHRRRAARYHYIGPSGRGVRERERQEEAEIKRPGEAREAETGRISDSSMSGVSEAHARINQLIGGRANEGQVTEGGTFVI